MVYISKYLQEYGFTIKNIISHNENKNIVFEVKYPSLVKDKSHLRSELKLEVIYRKELKTPSQPAFIQSFLAESKKEKPEVERVSCLSIEEISAGKLSALVWRMLDKSEAYDPRLIRHLYDLASLAYFLTGSRTFNDLCLPIIKHDLMKRAKPPLELSLALKRIIPELRINPFHQQNYRTYLENFIYKPLSDNHLSFENAVDKLATLLKPLM